MTFLSANRSFDALGATSCSVIITNATLPDNPIIYVNEAFTSLTGYTLQDAVGRNCRFLNGPDSDPVVRAEISAAIAAGKGIRREVLNYRKDGTAFWNDLTIDPIRDTAGRLTGFVGVQSANDALHYATEEKAEAERKLATIAEYIPGYIYRRVMHTDGSIRLAYCSPSLNILLGVADGDIAPTFYDHVHPDDVDALIREIRRSAADLSLFREEFRLVSSDGLTHWLRSDARPRRMDNGEIVWEGLAIEISAEKRWENEIVSQALRDRLTGLLTRTAWRDALLRQLKAQTGASARCAVICVDITALNELNDRLGQDVGDEILLQAAQRITRIAMSVGGTAGRLGGDEFALLVPECASEESLSDLARSVSETLVRPYSIGARQVTIETSVGATLSKDGEQGSPMGSDLASELMMQGELALRWARQRGRDFHVIYTRERDDRFQNRALLAQSLEQAITNGELELHYQPLVDLATGRIVSAEALVRWNHPSLGVQRPDLFIPLAEASGLIVPLGRWVMLQVLRQRQQWQDEGLAPPPIAINVSGVQLDAEFVAFAAESLHSSGARARDFEIELTEGLLIEPSPRVMAALSDLRSMGFTITIDDFGSGHATFRYLRDFPVDKLKIDRTFVRQLVLESTDALIIRAVIALARGMGIGFVAEGVETQAQRDFLEREGCLLGQGYFFSMPLVAEDFAWLLANDVRLPRRTPERQPTGYEVIHS